MQGGKGSNWEGGIKVPTFVTGGYIDADPDPPGHGWMTPPGHGWMSRQAMGMDDPARP